jgi:hypothetical protein
MQGADRETSSRIEELAPKDDLNFGLINNALANEIVKKHHYLKRSCNNIRWAWGIEVGGEILGVLTVGTLSSPTATRGVIGETKEASRSPLSRSKDVFELARLWLSDSLPVFEVQGVDRKTGKPVVHKHGVESQFIGWCLRQLKKEYPNIILISYADASAGEKIKHVGRVYQATNWIYAGQSMPFTNRTPKHRYCWLANPKDKALLAWKEQPYPKQPAA